MMLSSSGRAFNVMFAVGLMAGCADAGPPLDPAEVLTIRTVGLAYLEENRLDEAAVEFERLVEMAPREPLGYANLGLTYLRMGRLSEAQVEVSRALELEPAAPDVRLILAEIFLAQDRTDDARATLEAALEADPQHVKILYALASMDADIGDSAAAARQASALGQVVELQPANVAARVEQVSALLTSGDASAAAVGLEDLRQLVPEFPVEGQDLFDAALVAARAGDAPGARGPALAFHNVMRTTPAYQRGLMDLRGPGGVLVGFPLVTFSETFGTEVRDAETVLAALRFTDATDIVGIPAGSGAANTGVLAFADYDGDGDRDLFVGGRLLQNEITGFVDVTQVAGLASGQPSAALFGDYDNDGFLDLYVAADGEGRLYRNARDGSFSDVTSSLGLSVPAGAPLFLDFDQDGDLDLSVSGASGGFLLRNNLDGSFTDVTSRAGIGNAGAGGSMAFGDFDDDDDIDFVVSADGRQARVYDNERLGRFAARPEGLGSYAAGTGISSVGDYNNDGFLDVLVAPRGGRAVELYLNESGTTFGADDRPTALLASARDFDVHDAAFIDFDNDGWLDVLLVGESGDEGVIRLFRNAAAGQFDDVSDLLPDVPPLRRIATGDFGDDGDLDIFVSTADGAARLLRNDGGNANRYLKMQLVGLSTGSGKNNHFGLGAKLEVRAGGLYQTRVVTGPDIHIGLGQHARADVVRVRWPNGVPQNLFYPGANQSVVEEQILKGSCPFLYTWDGEAFTFVTDLMWKSALGMPMGLMAAGGTEYAPARPSQEYLRIPGEALRERDGRYEMRVTGELWEVFYIDEVDLVVVDHPDSVDVFVDERFVWPEPDAPLSLHQVSEKRRPLSAVDQLGRDVLPELLASDDNYVTSFEPDRYQGVSEVHDLVLDLGAFDTDESVELYLRGWIFPTDASINVAISQSEELETVMPHLEVVGVGGDWVTVVPVMSFPSGKNKTVIQDLTGLFPTDDHRVRLRTNMNIYWDEAFVSVGSPRAQVVMNRLEPTEADFRYRGFSRQYRKGGRFGPHWFDYEVVSEESPWRPIQGSYTRYGDVLPLIGEADDRYPIMGPGDELAILFDAGPVPPLPEGWSRDFLIYTEGWIKDADVNTADGWRVEPLPFHGMSRYPYGEDEAYPFPELFDVYHTREAVPVPPLGGAMPPSR